MQYFVALKIGEKRVKESREYLNKLCNDQAMPALALRDNKTNVWEPVGEENLYAVLNNTGGYVLSDSTGYMIVICDKNGISKALVRGLNAERKDAIVARIKSDNMQEHTGDVGCGGPAGQSAAAHPAQDAGARRFRERGAPPYSASDLRLCVWRGRNQCFDAREPHRVG